MKVVKKTGLVPVHTKIDKTVFGVAPAVAVKGVKQGTLFLVDIPEGVETVEFDVPAAPKAEQPADVDGVVQIPADWETLHYAKIIVLAKNLLGADLPEIEEKKPAEVARDIIREELSRRAAGNSENEAE
ncbi:hypothetical protein [Rhizobium azibense]|uniref:Uncharacterized protein n=1 Tax=Rhizobium azibense TaxID=1136135 RepID=A0A4R3RRC8_9HYPH|nr:hypothetical protein [Rhizobium azibense]TCU34156.1 hypothetical protein EV129_113141 [Rhizobium azibense]